MAHMTDAQHKTVGHTVLYVPDEGSAMASAEAHMVKELVQRLEGEGGTNVISTISWQLWCCMSVTCNYDN